MVKRVNHLNQLPRNVPLVLAIGSFDGVHRGHQKVIRAAQKKALQCGGQAWVLTLDPHPMKILNPGQFSPLLSSLNMKLKMFGLLGVDGCVVLPFNQEQAHVKPERFLETLKEGAPNLAVITVGTNWRFGHLAKGNTALLEEKAPELGLEAVVVDPEVDGEGVVSSTRIRAEISSGRMDKAAELLGRPFSVVGNVVEGHRQGRELGYPTANIQADNEMIPPSGIYAALVETGNRWFKGSAYIGHRKTFGDAEKSLSIEVFIIDFEGDLYNQSLGIYFIRKLRDDRKFSSLESLAHQIGNDVEAARDSLKEAMTSLGRPAFLQALMPETFTPDSISPHISASNN